MATATLTSPGTGNPNVAIRPSTPTGNQQRKSDMATVMRRRAMVESWVGKSKYKRYYVYEKALLSMKTKIYDKKKLVYLDC